MFKLYDLNLREIPFPDGVMPLDIFVGSISKSRETETIPGRNGVMNYGFNYDSRPVRITLLAEGNDRIDYRLIRNAVFEIFDLHDVFYIEETDVPSRVLKVTIDESYQPDRLTRDDASFDINLRTLDSVFWESKYTTLELHDSGYSATAEKYGLVDNIDDEKVKYRFEPERTTDALSSDLFEYGALSLANGQNSSDGNTDFVRTIGYIDVLKDIEYELYDPGFDDSLRYYRIFQFDGDDMVDSSVTFYRGNEPTKFISKGSRIRILIYTISDSTINISDIGTTLKPQLSRNSTSNTFSVYNAGNVTVEPESMFLEIYFNVATSDGDLTLRNNTTGEEFMFYRTINRRNLSLKGMIFQEGSTHRFRDTNKQFIRLVPGDNHFTMTGNSGGSIVFNFKYYYK